MGTLAGTAALLSVAWFLAAVLSFVSAVQEAQLLSWVKKSGFYQKPVVYWWRSPHATYHPAAWRVLVVWVPVTALSIFMAGWTILNAEYAFWSYRQMLYMIVGSCALLILGGVAVTTIWLVVKVFFLSRLPDPASRWNQHPDKQEIDLAEEQTRFG